MVGAPRLMLSAVTRRNRHEVTAEINDAVMAAGGWIANHTLFSNMATTFHCVLAGDRVSSFANGLHDLHVTLDDDSLKRVQDLSPEKARAEVEVNVALNVTFIHNEPDLRRDVPMVPG